MPHLSLPVTDPVLISALVMLIILLAPLLFKRLRMPGLVGLILAGVLVGPHTLGVLDRDGTIELLGTVGLLYIMFLAGLEMDLGLFARYRKHSLVFGALTFGLPQLLGSLVGRFALGFDTASALLFGSVLASHTLVAYPIISRLGLSKRPAVTTAVGATIITDAAALLVLAVIASAAEGELGAAFWIRFAGSLAVYVGAVFLLLPRLGRWFFRDVATEDGVSGFVFVLASVFTVSFLAELAGVEPIIGAFLAGLALNRLIPDQSTLMNRVHFVGNALFIPFFLLSVGMLVDPAVFLRSPSVWIVASVMIATLFMTKGLAALGTRPLFGYTADEGWVVFGLTVPQAAATLAAVIIGYDLDLFSSDVLNATILMILVTCVAGPYVAERYGRRAALAEAARPYDPAEAPQRILVPLVGGQRPEHLIELALLLRERTSTQPLYPLTVARDRQNVLAEVAASEKLLAGAAEYATAANVPVVPLTRVDADVTRGILRAITEERISTVVLCWPGGSTARNEIFGRVLDRLVEKSREMLLISQIVRPLNTTRRTVLVVPPLAHLEVGFAQALYTVKVLASQLGSPLVVVASQEDASRLEGLVERIRPVVPKTILPLPTWAGLVRALEQEVEPEDLLVMLAVRKGALAWRPGLERLPKVLPERFSHANQIFLYLAETLLAVPASVPAPAVADGPRLPLSPTHVALPLTGESWDEVIGQVLAPLAGGTGTPGRLTRQVLGYAGPDYAVELRPGVAVLHALLPEVKETSLYVGVSRDGLVLPRTAAPVHVVLVLLSPPDTPPDEHEQLLSRVVRSIDEPEEVERLRDAWSGAEVRHALKIAQPPEVAVPVA